MDDAGIAPQSRKAVPGQYVAGSVESVTFDVDLGHFGLGDLDAARIKRAVDVASDSEAGGRGGGADELDDDLMAHQRLAAPILGDAGEQSVLDAIPFAGTRRQIDDRHGKTRLVGEALKFTLPQADAGAIAATAVGSDGQGFSVRISDLALPMPPATDALDRARRGIPSNADIDPALVGGNVVDPIGRRLPQPLDFEVVDQHWLGITLAAQLATSVLEVANQLFFLASTEIAGSPAAIAAFTVALTYSNCALRSGC